MGKKNGGGMNLLQKITSKGHVIVFSLLIAALATVLAAAANLLLLDYALAKEVLLTGCIIAVTVGFAISYLVGIKLLEVNLLTAKLDHMASFDFLTGALTRAKFFGQLAANPAVSGAFLVFDMDNFKRINDTLGHATGDEALFKVASAARASFGPGDQICRLGGDEFCTFFPGMALAEARVLALWIEQRIAAETVGPDGHAIGLSASFGVALLKAGDEVDAAIAISDAELYHAKANRHRGAARTRPRAGPVSLVAHQGH